MIPRTLNAGDQVPAVTRDQILTIAVGIIGQSEIVADNGLLESVGTIKYTVYDPYENRAVEYEGILLESLFDQFGSTDTTDITVTAMDDYQQVVQRADAEKWLIILALKADGEYAQREHRGPSMIIYPYDDYPELSPSVYDPFWVWQVANITFN